MKDALLALVGTAGFATLIGGFLSKGKTKAETAKIIADTYGGIIDDLRTQLKFQGEQINQQSSQITLMQEREMKFLKMIEQHQEEKKALINQHTLIETELRGQIKALENKLANRILKIENKMQ